ncbi:MAG: MBL fold metallo-hydrolase [Balneola sp.]|jgi:glyoxylase-like metal-dependent hydrolase (beta-lactamase superfamily II)|nr:MBL fold metallo-hydrolase [Balneola sp.]MBE80516.1 MBL fold metallo-hydrolase [Balneola sp.]|tara:strand:- start:355 stop:1230 length:876 start_codon:yes stop_codon:yes gene_type:complete
MSLSKTTLGPFELYTIETGDFRLDGGAMFGVVPKTLWSRGLAADDNNRIPMTMRCLLIKSNNTGKVYLVDNGAGTKFSDKMEGIYQLKYKDKNLENSLKYHGFSIEDISDIIFTHLHFDHCGGSSFYNEFEELELTFPDANYHVVDKHWDNANNPNAREKASFLPENIQPIKDSGKLNLVAENHEYEKGLSALSVNGHTIGQQLPVIKADGKTLVFVADLLPTHVHVPLPWVMGYDMYPVQTLDEKEAFLKQASKNEWYLYLEHDAHEEVIRVQHEEGRFSVAETLSLNDL